VSEVNASDERRKEELENLYERTLAKGFRKHLFLLDEIDGMKDWLSIEKILSRSKHPIVLIANEYWTIPKKVRDLCQEVQFYKPQVRDIVSRVKTIAKAEGIEADLTKIGEDIRSSFNAIFYGGERREIDDKFALVDRILRKKLPFDKFSKFSEDDLIWLLDNAQNYYSGKQLYEAIHLIALASKTNVSVLSTLPEGKGKPEYPYTLRRRRMKKNDGK